MNNIAKIFYGVLFQPSETFKKISYEKPYKLPLVIVVIAALFLMLLNYSSLDFMLVSTFIGKAVSLVIYWLFFAFFIDLMGKMFKQESNFAKLLTLTSLSFIPWIFLAPIKLLQNSSLAIIGTIILLAIWGWTIVLQVLAISETYNIPRKNAIIILLIPFLGSILYFTWLIDFFVKLFQFSM